MAHSSDSSSPIAILDDDKNVRDGLAYAIESDEWEPIDQPGPLGTMEDFLARNIGAVGAVSDHKLAPAGYAQFTGAQLVAAWYRRMFPALLCTTYNKSAVDEFRSLRRWIPVVMPPDGLTPDTLGVGLELVRKEQQGDFVAERRPWRAVVRFTDYAPENRTVYAKLAGWSSEAVALREVDLPDALREIVTRKPDFLCHAEANLGTVSGDELYLSAWEFEA
ncbi:hypothetical protein [Microbacterium sp. YJN-G]|uniref:hypothetical protein n=1 Tax=Microbacterium sp. YJN-G TaxID=2763257 RepID=UPI0018787350|nr:hypothetical protein [Microbacterium sp. YJN-G]